MTDFTAMGLIPFLLRVHYILEYDKIVKEKAKVKESEFEVNILTDDQAVFITNGEVHFV